MGRAFRLVVVGQQRNLDRFPVFLLLYGKGSSLNGALAPHPLGIARLERHAPAPEMMAASVAPSFCGAWGSRAPTAAPASLPSRSPLGRVEVDPPAVVVNLPPQPRQGFLLVRLRAKLNMRTLLASMGVK